MLPLCLLLCPILHQLVKSWWIICRVYFWPVSLILPLCIIICTSYISLLSFLSFGWWLLESISIVCPLKFASQLDWGNLWTVRGATQGREMRINYSKSHSSDEAELVRAPFASPTLLLPLSLSVSRLYKDKSYKHTIVVVVVLVVVVPSSSSCSNSA